MGTTTSTPCSLPCLQGLVGRVRIALDGLNATLGGSLAALRQHAEAVEARFGAGGAPIDFKLAESSGRRSAATMRQSVSAGAWPECLLPVFACSLLLSNTSMRRWLPQGFDRLSVQMCKEVVSLGLPDFLPSATSNDDGGGDASLVLPAGARHVEPEEFHAMLAAAAGSGCGSVARGGGSQGSDGGSSVGGSSRETVLIDTRNFYETQVGRFEVVGVLRWWRWLRCGGCRCVAGCRLMGHQQACPWCHTDAASMPCLALPCPGPLRSLELRCWTRRSAASQTRPPGWTPTSTAWPTAAS